MQQNTFKMIKAQSLNIKVTFQLIQLLLNAYFNWK